MAKKSGNNSKQVLDPQNVLSESYFGLINKVGSKGKYQRNLFLIFVLLYFVNGAVMLSTSFIFMNSRYACQQKGLLVQDCRESVCSIESIKQRKKYFAMNSENVQSVAIDYGPFMCEDQYQLDMVKSSPYFGSFLGYSIFAYISNKYGRRPTMILSLGLATLGTLIVAVGYNLIMIAIGVVMAGAGINVSAGMVFYFLGETVEDLKRQKYSVLVQIASTIAAIIITVLYYFIGTWRIIFILITTIPAVITFFFFVLYVQQTPQFLLQKQNKKTLKSLNRIGYINYGLKDILSEEDLQNVKLRQFCNEKKGDHKLSLIDLFRFSSLRKATILGSVLCYVSASMYFGPILIIDKVGFNSYATSLAIQFSQIFCFIPVYYFIEKVKKKTVNFYTFFITVVMSLIVIMLKKPEKCDMCLQSIIELVAIFIFRFSIGIFSAIFQLYSVELFPTRAVALGIGVLGVFGTVASTSGPLIIGFFQRANLNVMLYFLISGIIGCIASLLLDQTHGKPIKTEIDEIFLIKMTNQSQKSQTINTQQSFDSFKKDI